MDDLFRIEDQFSDEQRLIKDSVNRFVQDEMTPYFADYFEKAKFPTVFIKRAAELGLLGITLPEQYGGSNASYMTYGIVCQELEKGDSALRSFVSVQSSLCMYPIFKYGTEEQKKHFLPQMAGGEIIGCFGLTEPDAGSDPLSMKTHAKKTKGGWILNGSKMWITNAPIAHIAIVWAHTDDGIRGFIVETGFKGVRNPEIHHKMSLRASITGELAFDNVFIPDSHFLPGSEKGFAAALSCLNQARFGICWGAIGAAQACFDIAQGYLLDRKQFDKPLASFQLIQNDLSLMFTEIVKAQLVNLQLAKLKDSNLDNPIMTSVAKGNACREALNIARTCRNLLGGNGISLEYHVIRHMLNLESVFTYEGTDNVHKLVVGRYLTGINAFGG
jgi:glutaryl-CoA dehydrogenase